MKYTVIGTGAIGGYYGAMLQRSGFEVNFLARSDYSYIIENGLKIDSVDGNFTLDKVNVFSLVQDLPISDVILVSTKTTSNGSLSELLEPIVKDGTIILIMQNGLGMEEEFQKMFPQATIIGGMCFICSQKKGPGYISHLDKGSITISPLNIKELYKVQELKEDFIKAGITNDINESLNSARWYKLLWNIPFNGLSVALRANTKEILESEHGYNLAKQLMKEVALGAKSCGVEIDPSTIDKMLKYTQEMIPYEPSMKLDFNNNREMEIEYIYRKPIEQAKLNGIDLPAINILADQLSFLQKYIV